MFPASVRAVTTEPPELGQLVADLAAEHEALDAVVAPLAEPQWDLPTPAAGWAVRDQISHLAFFDDAAALALRDPGAFGAEAQRAMSAAGDPMQDHLDQGRALAPPELLQWWHRSCQRLLQALERVEPATRVPWFGPPMGARSFVTARLMETWAHGTDVTDALGRAPQASGRLRHVAELGVRTRPYSYAVRRLAVPPGVITVELTGPAAERWVWVTSGGGEVVATVRGPALDFCLVVTQRRNVADTALQAEGAAAEEWLQVAQAFAGPAGAGRPPSAVA